MMCKTLGSISTHQLELVAFDPFAGAIPIKGIQTSSLSYNVCSITSGMLA